MKEIILTPEDIRSGKQTEVVCVKRFRSKSKLFDFKSRKSYTIGEMEDRKGVFLQTKELGVTIDDEVKADFHYGLRLPVLNEGLPVGINEKQLEDHFGIVLRVVESLNDGFKTKE